MFQLKSSPLPPPFGKDYIASSHLKGHEKPVTGFQQGEAGDLVSFTLSGNDSGCHMQGGMQGCWRAMDEEEFAGIQGGARGLQGGELGLPTGAARAPPSTEPESFLLSPFADSRPF